MSDSEYQITDIRYHEPREPNCPYRKMPAVQRLRESAQVRHRPWGTLIRETTQEHSQGWLCCMAKKNRERDGPTRVGSSKNDERLPGGESSPTGPTGRAGTALELAEPDDEGRCRENYRRSGPLAFAQEKREAAPQPGGTRVRFEFARRAHQRKFTPRLGINRATMDCQEERGVLGEKSAASFAGAQKRDGRAG
jgi:hypothetical protein